MIDTPSITERLAIALEAMARTNEEQRQRIGELEAQLANSATMRLATSRRKNAKRDQEKGKSVLGVLSEPAQGKSSPTDHQHHERTQSTLRARSEYTPIHTPSILSGIAGGGLEPPCKGGVQPPPLPAGLFPIQPPPASPDPLLELVESKLTDTEWAEFLALRTRLVAVEHPEAAFGLQALAEFCANAKRAAVLVAALAGDLVSRDIGAEVAMVVAFARLRAAGATRLVWEDFTRIMPQVAGEASVARAASVVACRHDLDMRMQQTPTANWREVCLPPEPPKAKAS